MATNGNDWQFPLHLFLNHHSYLYQIIFLLWSICQKVPKSINANRKLNLLDYTPRDYAGTIHFHMNGSLHKMTGISISNQYPGPHKAHCAACNSTFKIDWGVILSIKQYEVAKSIKNLEGYKRLSFVKRLQFTEKSILHYVVDNAQNFI